MFKWKSPEISFFVQKPSFNGVFEANLKVNEDIEFETREGEVLSVSIFQDFSH